jgi:hypothetical protein
MKVDQYSKGGNPHHSATPGSLASSPCSKICGKFWEDAARFIALEDWIFNA